MTTCNVPECTHKAGNGTSGMCWGHYSRKRRGSQKTGPVANMVKPGTMTPSERFWLKVEKTEECWNWTGSKLPDGYGHFSFKNPETLKTKTFLSHRFAFEEKRGPISADKELHHLCENKGCVNPSHLEEIAHVDHVHKTPASITYKQAQMTHCKRGHAFTKDNTRIGKKNQRTCLTCERNGRPGGPGRDK
jgi:HNH endonuclease